MEIQVNQRDAVTVVSIDGSIDGLTAGDLLAALRSQVAASNTRIVADLGGVTYTSSAGLRALLETVKETRQRGGDLRLAAVRPEVLRVLELSGFTGILKVYPDVDAAMASFAA
jgi:anti-sigma B factor antagonist